MKVRCVKIINEITGEEQKTSPWVTIGKIYVVLNVFYAFHDHSISYRLISDENSSPAIFNIEQFEILDSTIPANWSINFVPGKYFELAATNWQKAGFWEAYFNDEQWAIDLFNQELKIMIDDVG